MEPSIGAHSILERTAEDDEVEEGERIREKDALLQDLLKRRRPAGAGQAEEAWRGRAGPGRATRAETRHGQRSVPRLGGPEEDANPIIDYIIKKRKRQRSGSGGPSLQGLSAADLVASAVQDARRHNSLADMRQLDGARRRLSALGHDGPVVLMTERINGRQGDDA